MTPAEERSLPPSTPWTRWRTERGRFVARTEAAETPGLQEGVIAVEGCVLGEAEIAALAHEGVCPGGAFVGTVVTAGAEAAEWIGRRVLCAEALPCGQCEVCQRGRGPACARPFRPGVDGAGALASHVRVPVRYLVPIGTNLPGAPWSWAAIAGPVARSYHALVRAGLGPGELAVFVGTGAEASFGAHLAAARAAHALVLAPSHASPEQVGARLGEVASAVKVWRIFETTRRAGGVAAALALARPTGTLSFMGATGAAPTLHRPSLLEIPVLVTGPPHPDLLVELLALVARGELDLAAATHEVTPATLPEAAQALLEGKGPLCPIFCPRALDAAPPARQE